MWLFAKSGETIYRLRVKVTVRMRVKITLRVRVKVTMAFERCFTLFSSSSAAEVVIPTKPMIN